MITKRIQIQTIADRLAGLPPTVGSRIRTLKPSDFDEPWRTCWKALEQAVPGQERNALMRALDEIPEREWVIGSILSAHPGAPLGDFPSLQDLAAGLPEIEWIWPGWMPRGMITLLGSVPGAGKSFLALDLARRVLQREPFPDGSGPHPGPHPDPLPRTGEGSQRPPLPQAGEGRGEGLPRVLYVDAEAVPQLLNERARSWGMDTSQLYLMLPEPGEMLDFGHPEHRDRLIEMAAHLSPELIIIDSLSSVSSKGENNIEDVRILLGFLNMLAQDFHTGLLLIHHLRKSGSLQTRSWEVTIDDFRGSGHITAMARSVLGLSIIPAQAEQDNNGPRKLEVVKTNLGPYPDPLGFEFTSLETNGISLEWGPPAKPYHPPTLRDHCQAWLVKTLRQNGPMRPVDLEKLGKEAGFSRATIRRARQRLGKLIENTSDHHHPRGAWKWAGPESDKEAER